MTDAEWTALGRPADYTGWISVYDGWQRPDGWLVKVSHRGDTRRRHPCAVIVTPDGYDATPPDMPTDPHAYEGDIHAGVHFGVAWVNREHPMEVTP